ncbi:hypothetical protein PBI_121Q_364 [Escherichia phage 121Q]|uniref:Uncharacterized protein n=1 Tax=Escherichia phage 121Q TaxID=1555202 RepID=A0A097EXS4_9CAUD|nr:hypothetical protein PBI_121Q_364 [Escherichia phage 121Q]AIT14254.1 hypothetical protein PBI_121Q_364 [Escherichia phage 121Q]
MLRYMFNIKFYIVFFRVQFMFPETKKIPRHRTCSLYWSLPY